MKTYRVVASELVYSYCYVDAENAEDAMTKAMENFEITDWETLDIGDFRIEKADLIEE